MQAWIISNVGSGPTLGTIDLPRVEDQQHTSLVQMLMVAVNQVDISVAMGVFPAGRPKVPYVPGIEGVACITQSSQFPVGTVVRVSAFRAGYGPNGVMAEYAVIDNDDIEPIPDGVSPEVVAATGNSALTGWLAMRVRGNVHQGDRALILGATGASGWYAMQAARHAGASSVVAVARDAAALDAALNAGATATVQLTPNIGCDELAEKYRLAAGGEVTVTYDALWGLPALAALTAEAKGARHVVVGQAAANELNLPCYLIRVKTIDLLGFANHQIPRLRRHEAMQEMLELSRDGSLDTSKHTTLSFANLDSAWEQKRTGECRRPLLRVAQ